MVQEEPKRLAPTSTVTRNLYLASGNRCAFPGCDSPLMRADGVLVGEIAHIEAASQDGPRFNHAMTNEERRGQANLMLMCATCHTVIDADVTTWTADKLKALKASHEAVYTGAVDLLRRQVGDITEGITWTSPANLGGVYEQAEHGVEELAADVQIVNDLAAKLASIPLGARSVLALIVARGDIAQNSMDWDTEVTIPVSLLKGIAGCSGGELREHLQVIEHVGLGWLEEPFAGDPLTFHVGKSTGSFGWKVFGDIKRLADGDAKVIRQAIIDLDFTVLDVP